jgi:diadenosine tetraphosphate (Ap4A) HIT family hydrolase
MPGSVLAFPRRHVRQIADLQDHEADELIVLLLAVTRAIGSTFNPAGLNTWWAEGVAAAQTFEHLTVELVPRYPDVEYRFMPYPEVPESDRTDLTRTRDALVAALVDGPERAHRVE